MNITHFDDREHEGDRLLDIFNRQKELMEKYHDIELRSGLLQTEDCPVNLNDRKGQARIKDFAWRVTEELGEALDALYGDDDYVHYKEELIDGLHFLVELTILAGVTPEQLVPDDWDDDMGDMLEGVATFFPNDLWTDKGLDFVRRLHYVEHIRLLGMTCNCLKNKPWKQSMMMTDEEAFTTNLKDVWYNYLSLLNMEIGMEETYQTYFKKSEVNKFRQRSNY